MRDELTGWLRSLDKIGHEQDRAFYLESSSGLGSFTFDRIGRGKTFVKNLTLSLLGTIQPSMIAPYIRGSIDGYGDDGLVQRIQLLVYPEPPKNYEYIDRLPKGRDLARNTFEKLYSMTADDFGAATSSETSDEFPYLQFDDVAQRYFEVWFTFLEIGLRSVKFENSAIESHIAKYRSLMPSLALIFHLIDRAAGANRNNYVSLKYVKLAESWCEYLQKHAEKIYGMVTLSEFDYAREILDHIKAKKLADRFTARDIYRKGWKNLKKPSNVKDALDTLEGYGYLSSEVVDTGGRKIIEYSVHESLKKNEAIS